MRVSSQEVREELTEMITDYIATSEKLGYCNDCPELRYCDDTGCYDCPYGLDCTSCEYDCTADIDSVVDELMRVIEGRKP